eukprot:3931672-Rhodomonas_salina.2
MDSLWFIKALDTLVLVDYEFQHLLYHPVLDNVTSVAFKQHVVLMCVNHCLVFPVAADNANPASAAKFQLNLDYIVKSLKAIQSQISDACSKMMETIFVRAKGSPSPQTHEDLEENVGQFPQ